MRYSYFRHPNAVKMSYLQHFKVSSTIGFQFLNGSFKAFVHAFIPSLFVTSSSDLIKDQHKKLK